MPLALSASCFSSCEPDPPSLGGYTIQFETNGGSSIQSITVPRGGKITLPEEPTKKNFFFARWYIDRKLTFPFDAQSSINKDLTLYAKWVEEEVIFTFDQGARMVTGLQSTYGYLTHISIPSKVSELTIEGIGETAFKADKQLRQVTIREGVRCISGEAFAGCISMTSISIPQSVGTIGDRAFGSCISLPNIIIPHGVERIGYGTFIHCYNLTSVSIPSSVKIIKARAFENCYQLAFVEIPHGIVDIEDRTFGWCYSLRNILIPDGVKIIGESAFEECISLPTVNIPDGVVMIQDRAFEGDTSLTHITLPRSVASIGFAAFKRCKSLTLTFQATDPTTFTAGAHAFDEVPKLRVPKEALDAYTQAFQIKGGYEGTIEGY